MFTSMRGLDGNKSIPNMDVLDPKRAASRKLLSGSGPQLNLKYRIKVWTKKQAVQLQLNNL